MGWFGRDEYRDNANESLDKVRRYCREKYGSDRDVLYHEVGKRLQERIDCMNNQGGRDANRRAVARWQIFKALYPEYIQDEMPTPRPELWNEI